MTHPQQQTAQPACNEPYAIVLATLAGNEYHTPANLAHYEDLSQLEDDIVSFLPTVSDIEVFGCEVDLIMPPVCFDPLCFVPQLLAVDCQFPEEGIRSPVSQSLIHCHSSLHTC